MKKILVLTLVALVLVFATAGLSFADNGPHGGYTGTADGCAGCHRAHTASGPNLLIASSTQALCFTCHGDSGTGADTNVWDGVYLDRDLVTESPAEGVDGRGLKGGGFVNVLMDHDLSATSASEAQTSAHTYDDSSGTMWGNGAIGSGPGGSLNLDCANCHDPHGSAGAGGVATYRILRDIPDGSGGGGTTVADVASKTYSVSDANNQYWDQQYGATGTELANWCSECHTRYLAGSGSGSTDSTDPIFAYRHRTNASFINCMDCHVAHGTSATMGTQSGAVEWPDDPITTISGNARSSLLRVDNRGVCQQCHNK